MVTPALETVGSDSARIRGAGRGRLRGRRIMGEDIATAQAGKAEPGGGTEDRTQRSVGKRRG